MAESLRGGLSLCLSGFGFWSHDIGGFEQTAPADVYKRWIAFGLLSTHSRLHGSSSYRVPWLYDEEAVDVLRHFTKLRCAVMPYLWSQANLTAQTGIPMLRAMVLEFPDAPCRYLDTQYMLGDALLVAPVFGSSGRAEYYLPKGRWTDLLTGESKEGGTYYEDTYDFFHLPLYIRPDTILPVGGNCNDVDYDFEDDVTLIIAPLESGKEARCTLYRRDGSRGLTLTVKREGDSYLVTVLEARKRVKLLFYDLPEAATVTGAKRVEYHLDIIPGLKAGQSYGAVSIKDAPAKQKNGLERARFLWYNLTHEPNKSNNPHKLYIRLSRISTMLTNRNQHNDTGRRFGKVAECAHGKDGLQQII